MVLDPFSAISLASSIVAFVDFSIKLVSLGNEIRRSEAGVSSSLLDLQLVSDDLSRVTKDLGTESSNALASANPDLDKIRQRCQDLAGDIAATIQKLRGSGSKKRWTSYVQAMKEVGQQSRLKTIAENLRQLQTALTLSLVAHFSKKQSAMMSSVNSLIRQYDEYQVTDRGRVRQIDHLRTEVLDTLSSIKADSTLTRSRVTAHMNSFARLKPLHHEDVQDLSNAMNALTTQMKDLVIQGMIATREQKILKCLHFERLQARRETIPDAHVATLGWVFEPQPPECYTGPPIGFVDWLRKGDGIYWIKGKPGSGKSTLMKYLCKHAMTLETLNQWASPEPAIVASYFFWSGGTDLQKSQHGLLQSLLFDICRQCPMLINEIFQYSVEMTYDTYEWSFGDLQMAIEKLAQLTHFTTRFCFFIDGLDEYNTQLDSNISGEPFVALIKTIQSLAALPNVKLCVSSRAENAFLEAFEHSASGKLALEDINRQDIKNLVELDLASDPRFIIVQRTEPRYSTFVDTICEKADGVFLWAVLVVKTLQEAIFTDHESYETVERLLYALPSDLRAFFLKILDRISDNRKQKTAEAFRIMLTAPQAPRLLTFSFLDNYHEELAFQTSPPETNEKMLSEEIITMHRRINGRCKLLLTVTGIESERSPSQDVYHEIRVEFLHRTVRDFLMNEDLSDLFNLLPANYDADLRLAESALYHLKRCSSGFMDKAKDTGQLFDRSQPISNLWDLLAYHAQRFEERTNQSLDRLINATIAFQPHFLESQQDQLSYFLQRGVDLYVDNKLDEPQVLQAVNLNKLLFDAVCHPSKPPLNDNHSPRGVEILLERYADPNSNGGTIDAVRVTTIWCYWVQMLATWERWQPHGNALFEITKLLIEHGAYCDEIINWHRKALKPRQTGRAADIHKPTEKMTPIYARQILGQLNMFTAAQKAELRAAMANQQNPTFWKRVNLAMRFVKTNYEVLRSA